MVGRGMPGVGLDVAKWERYVLLIEQGYSNSAACRLLKSNRRTGARWRYGRWERTLRGQVRKHSAVITKTRATPLSDRYLSAQERILIADRRRAGATVRLIAAELGRSASTVCRELRRNTDPDSGRYYPLPRAPAGRGTSGSAGTGQAAAGRGVAARCRAGPGEAVEPRADRSSVARPVS